MPTSAVSGVTPSSSRSVPLISGWNRARSTPVAMQVTRANQPIDDRTLPMIEAAHALGIALVASASLLQGQVARNLPPFIAEALGLENDAERALQFVRSTPGIATALVGMSRVEHVRANLRLVGIAPAAQDVFTKLFERRAPAP